MSEKALDPRRWQHKPGSKPPHKKRHVGRRKARLSAQSAALVEWWRMPTFDQPGPREEPYET